MAPPGIVQDAVFNSVKSVARVINRLGQRGDLACRNVAVTLRHRDHPEMADLVMRPEIGRIPGNDTVEVAGIALRLGEGFLAALRAAAEIRMRRTGSIERFDDRFI